METGLATIENNTLAQLLNDKAIRTQIASVMPQELDAKRFIKIAIAAATRTPGLMLCTQESLLKCLMDLSSLGLEPDGRRAHLIPYGKVCTLVIDYKGLADLVRRSGEVKTIQCAVVYQNEFDQGRFILEYGSNARLVHQPILIGDRGDVIGAYSCVMMSNGEESFHWMRKDEIDAIRARSKAGNNGPWKTDYNEMAKKTVFRQHTKLLPFSAETREKMEADDKYQFEQQGQSGSAVSQITGSLNDRVKGNLEAAKAQAANAESEPSVAVSMENTVDVQPLCPRALKLKIQALAIEVYAADSNKFLATVTKGQDISTLPEVEAQMIFEQLEDEAERLKQVDADQPAAPAAEVLCSPALKESIVKVLTQLHGPELAASMLVRDFHNRNLLGVPYAEAERYYTEVCEDLKEAEAQIPAETEAASPASDSTGDIFDGE